jgi:drug/metabolite transporter (DMT)-like permease
VVTRAPASPGGKAWIAAGLLSLAVLFWAGNWVIGRMIRLDAPAAGLTFVRWAIAAGVLTVFCWRPVRAHLSEVRQAWPILLLLGLLASVLQHMPVYIGLQTTTATTASLLNATTPVFILLMAWVMLGERLTATVVAGVAVSLAGAVWIVTRGEPDMLVRWVLNVGDLWILFGTLSWAVYTICLRWRPAALPAMPLLWAICVFGALCSLPVAAVEYAMGGRFIWSAPVVVSVLYISLCSTVLAYIFWNRGVQVLGPGRAGPFMYLMPVYTPVLGWVFLGESMEMFHVVGIVLIFAGILLARRSAAGGEGAR